MHRVSSSDRQVGASADSLGEHDDQVHNELTAISTTNEQPLSRRGLDTHSQESEPQSLLHSSATSERQQGQIQRIFLVPFELVCEVVRMIMNAAVTIFGMGVGVGLILGDSFRQPPMNGTVDEGAPGQGRNGDSGNSLSSSRVGTGGGRGNRGEGVDDASALSRPSLSDLPPQ